MKARLALLALAAVLTPACGGGTRQATVTPPGPVPDTTAPLVLSKAPAAGAAGVPINAAVTVVFSEAMDAAAVTSSFTLTDGVTPVVGVMNVSGSTATFTPAGLLATATLYTAQVTTAAKDLAGNPISSSVAWTFTTGASSDVTPPTVTLTSPVNGATGVGLNAALSATFSEAMIPSTLNATTFTLADGGGAVVGTVAYVGGTATFTPAANLAASTVYTATITTGAQDLAGNGLAAPFVWSFTTGTVADTSPPIVVSTTPAPAATGVPQGAVVTATFNEPMNPATLNGVTFLLSDGAAVAGTVSYDAPSSTATFTPSAALAPLTTFTATLTTGVQDLAGLGLASSQVWTFTTAPDTTPPTVTSTSPATGATGVSTGATVTATFSEPMAAATINATTFTLLSVGLMGAVPVPGLVTYAGTTATFTPLAPLPASSFLVAQITVGATDTAGNPLAAPYVWTFQTGP